jgi:hypothetical protein
LRRNMPTARGWSGGCWACDAAAWAE